MSDLLKCTDYNMGQYLECLIEKFKVANNGSGCRYLLGELHLPEVPFCPPHNRTIEVKTIEAENEVLGEENFTNMDAVAQITLHFIREGLNNKEGHCYIPCRSNQYEVENIPLNYLGDISTSTKVSQSKTNYRFSLSFSDEEALGGRILYISYATQFDSINREYVLYNFGNIIASAGGAVGLFLGFSLLSALNCLNKAFFSWLQSRKTLWSSHQKKKLFLNALPASFKTPHST